MTNTTPHIDEADETDAKLKIVSNHLVDSYIPLIVFLCLLTIVGVSGNITTTAYFGRKKKKSSTDMFITILALVDLFVCLLICLYIGQLLTNISVYTNKFLCKAAYFIYHWGILLSISVVCAIAVDRFKKICRPFDKQLTSKISIWICLVLFFISGLLSSRDFWTYDSFAVNVTFAGLMGEGRLCMNTRNEALRDIVIASHAIDVAIVAIVLLILVVTYAGIVKSLYNHKKKMESIVFRANVNSNQSTPGSVIPSPTTRTSFQFTQIISKTEIATTLMMLTVSVGLLVCFVPYFIATLTKLRGADIEYELTAWYRFAISAVLANSVINPIIYLMFNPKYRQYLKNRFFRCVRRRNYTIDTSKSNVST